MFSLRKMKSKVESMENWSTMYNRWGYWYICPHTRHRCFCRLLKCHPTTCLLSGIFSAKGFSSCFLRIIDLYFYTYLFVHFHECICPVCVQTSPKAKDGLGYPEMTGSWEPPWGCSAAMLLTVEPPLRGQPTFFLF